MLNLILNLTGPVHLNTIASVIYFDPFSCAGDRSPMIFQTYFAEGKETRSSLDFTTIK